MPAGLDPAAVTPWLLGHVDGVEAPFAAELIAGGRSNLTFKVEPARGRSLVIRRPPLGHVLESAHDMGREHRVISAIAGTGVPVPQTFGLCRDRELIGADFYVMEFVEGIVPHEQEEGALIAAEDRHRLSMQIADILAELHALEPADVGLDDLGRKEDYVPRQLRRWAGQWEQNKQREIPEMDEARRLLEASVPVQARSTIVHGDYRLGNMIIRNGRVQAVLDWELCTLGDPMADVGYLLNQWVEPGEDPIWKTAPTQAGSFATKAELLARYASASGADVSDVAFYRAFSSWRMASILEGVYARYRLGVMGEPDFDLALMADAVPALARAALEQLGE